MSKSYNSGSNNPKWKGGPKMFLCLNCGIDFSGGSHTQRVRKYCSHRCSKLGRQNSQWKENPTYRTLHQWINNNKPKPDRCECCGQNKKLDAANISGEYKRDLSDWEYLCRKCHMKKDGRINNLVQFKANDTQ